MTMKRRHVSMTDAEWEAQKAANLKRTQEALRTGAYNFATLARVPTVSVVSASCGGDCPECGGAGYTIKTDADGDEYALDCSIYALRRRENARL